MNTYKICWSNTTFYQKEVQGESEDEVLDKFNTHWEETEENIFSTQPGELSIEEVTE